MADTAPSFTAEYSIQDVYAEMDELGRAKWDAALARVETRLLRNELARVVARDATVPDGPPPAGEPEPVSAP